MSAVKPPLNNYQFLRCFSVNDEWLRSVPPRETVAPSHKHTSGADCHICHLPRTHGRNDGTAKIGTIGSHRWLGANTITPFFYGQTKQLELSERFLRDHVLSVDIFALIREATGTVVAPLSAENSIELNSGEKVTAEVVLFNRKAAHTFPPKRATCTAHLPATVDWSTALSNKIFSPHKRVTSSTGAG